MSQLLLDGGGCHGKCALITSMLAISYEHKALAFVIILTCSFRLLLFAASHIHMHKPACYITEQVCRPMLLSSDVCWGP